MIFKNPRLLFPFFMALIMAFVMSGLMTLLNLGFVSYFFKIWIRNFAIGFSCAFPTAFIIAPWIQKLVAYICKPR